MLRASGVSAVPEGQAWIDNDTRQTWAAMLAVAPMPPHETLTLDEARSGRHWQGMDGATAWHLIERHANGWGDVGNMMQAWLDANKSDDDINACGSGAGCLYKDALIESQAETIARLRAELAAERKDAMRYRFLRADFSPMGLNIDGNHVWAYRRNATLKGPDLNAAIDAAMAGR
jgi:hypothetical protein